VPTHHGIWLYDQDCFSPARPYSGQKYPEYSIPLSQSWTFLNSLEHIELLTQGEVLSSQIGNNIEPLKDPRMTDLDEFRHQRSLHDRSRNFNDISADEYLRGTGRTKKMFGLKLRRLKSADNESPEVSLFVKDFDESVLALVTESRFAILGDNDSRRAVLVGYEKEKFRLYFLIGIKRAKEKIEILRKIPNVIVESDYKVWLHREHVIIAWCKVGSLENAALSIRQILENVLDCSPDTRINLTSWSEQK
jgi:hypothetical protein